MSVDAGKNWGRKLVPRVSYGGKKPVPFEEYIPLTSSRDGLAGAIMRIFPQGQTKWKRLIHSALFDRQVKVNEMHVAEISGFNGFMYFQIK